MKSGFVSLIGRPNVGKSTLLNTLINEKIAITSNKAQTTRNIIQGIYNEEGYQIVFMDTPGIHKPQGKLGKILNKESYSLTKDVDVILFVIDASTGIGPGDKFIMESLKTSKVPVVLVMNKIDLISDERLLLMINEYKDYFNFSDIVPVSAMKNDNVKRLIDVLKGYLKDDVMYFDPNTKTSNSIYFMISELVREKLLHVTIEEVPHSLTCITTNFEEEKDLVRVSVDIIVDRDSIKKIVIGKRGERLKKVGTLARREIEGMVNKKVYLELYVRTVKNWRDKDKYLKELGFHEFDA
ncbi:MAG: GTPase Era [Bacilli bacterium]|nr:GTPase Era [Bacilli bacterium]